MTATLPQTLLDLAEPWPDTEGVRPWNYTIGGYRRDMVDDLIKALPANPVMLEIGCFMGASARRWLSLRDDLTLIGVDPWTDHLIEQVNRYVGRPNLTRAYPNIEDHKAFAADVLKNGPYPTALANLEPFRDRFIPIRDFSPGILPALRDAGAEPHLVYIDANKQPEDLDVCHELWPDAQITGDDWHWSNTKGYPMRQIVYAFAEKNGFEVDADHATWVLHRKQP